MFEVETYIKSAKRAMADPDWFCNKILRSPNDPWQRTLMEAIADLDRHRMGLPINHNHELKNRFSVSACQGPGKTHVMGKIIHWFNFTRVGRIACTAPKEKQVITRVWPEIRKLNSGAVPGYQKILDIQQTKIVWLKNLDHCALVEAASQPENLQGLHDDFLLFCIEEASGVSETMFPVIEGALTTPNAVMLMIGNPTRNEGEFYDSRHDPENKKLYFNMKVSYLDAPKRISAEWVEQMRRKYGEKSPIYKIRCMGEDAQQDANQLVPLAWIDNAVATDESEWNDGSFARWRIVADIADGGEDETVITVQEIHDTTRCLRHLVRHSWEPSIAVVEAAYAIERMADAWAERLGISMHEIELVVDGIGVGAGTAGTLIKRGLSVIVYKSGSTHNIDTKKYRNLRSRSYLTWRDELREDRFFIAHDAIGAEDWNDFCKQVISIRAVPGTERIEEVESKQRMKQQRGMKSPDMADAVAMGYIDAMPTLGDAGVDLPVVEVATLSGGMHAWDE